ncbi:TldD/PmbA family protein [Longispora albida]|uniref:TldD/PmbA family protein n=1 Tax=Longispora albida TaxID=203523 RepID=UPI00036CB932|nr:metallopeptidase TldD-related protein [Longispora albida]
MTELVERVLGLVGGRGEADVVADRTNLELTRFANSFIHQNVSDSGTRLRLRVHVDGRTATGTTTRTDSESLAAFVEQTIAQAKVCPPDPGWPGLAGPAPLPSAGNSDPETVSAGPDARARQVRAFVDAAGGLVTAGYCRTVGQQVTYGSTAGQLVTGTSSSAAMDAIARAVSGADGVARWSGVSLSGLDGARLGAIAAAKARASEGATELEPGRYEVVLEPAAVLDVLGFLSSYGFNGKAVAEGRSFLRPGERQFDPSITLADDPEDPEAVGLPFDVEGTPKRRLELVTAGVSQGPIHDRRTAYAAGAGATSTGHGNEESSRWGPAAANLLLEPGTTPAKAVGGPVASDAVGGLVGGVERGLLVTDFWYTRVLDPRSVAVTGLTRNGVWLIEDGVITRPVRNMRFTQSYPEALAPGSVLGIGSEAVSLPLNWALGTVRAPALRLASWNFTGGASG